MTQDEIIRSPIGREQLVALAREAGMETVGPLLGCLERFAALVAAHVTEALTKSHEAAFKSYVDQAKADRELESLAARMDEREACAKVCEEKRIQMNYSEAPYNQCAAAIRARSNQ